MFVTEVEEIGDSNVTSDQMQYEKMTMRLSVLRVCGAYLLTMRVWLAERDPALN